MQAIAFPDRDLLWKPEREHKIFKVVREEAKEKMAKQDALKAARSGAPYTSVPLPEMDNMEINSPEIPDAQTRPQIPLWSIFTAYFVIGSDRLRHGHHPKNQSDGD